MDRTVQILQQPRPKELDICHTIFIADHWAVNEQDRQIMWEYIIRLQILHDQSYIQIEMITIIVTRFYCVFGSSAYTTLIIYININIADWQSQ